MHDPPQNAPSEEELERLARVAFEAGHPAPADPDAPVAHKTFCVHCNYNLYTLSRHGVCPECGNPVADSLRTDVLEYADPRWVRRVANGGLIIASLSVGWFILLFLFLVSSRLESPAGRILSALWTSGMGVVGGIGLWLFSTAEPSAPFKLRRLFARLSALLHLASQVVWSIYLFGFDLGPDKTFAAWIICSTLSLTLLTPWSIHLAKRTRDGMLAPLLRLAGVFSTILLTIFAAWNILPFLGYQNIPARFDALVMWLIYIWFFLAFLAVPLFFLAWMQFSYSLTRAAKLAYIHHDFPDSPVRA